MVSHQPPHQTVEHVKSLIAAHVLEQVRHRQAYRAEFAKIEEQKRKLLLGVLGPREAELKALAAQRRELREARAKRGLHLRGQDVRPLSGLHTADSSSIIIKAPPYDFSWTSGSGQGSEGADQNAGTYQLAVQSFGNGELSVAAGIGFWFFSAGGNPSQRFAAVCDYADDWFDDAFAYVAHNDGRTRLWVFGVSENAWVVQSDQTPSWSDGVGWFESHGNDSAGGDGGRVASETFFTAQPNSWYQCWVWSSASVYSDGGFFGFSDSSIHMSMSVPFAVMGSL